MTKLTAQRLCHQVGNFTYPSCTTTATYNSFVCLDVWLGFSSGFGQSSVACCIKRKNRLTKSPQAVNVTHDCTTVVYVTYDVRKVMFPQPKPFPVWDVVTQQCSCRFMSRTTWTASAHHVHIWRQQHTSQVGAAASSRIILIFPQTQLCVSTQTYRGIVSERRSCSRKSIRDFFLFCSHPSAWLGAAATAPPSLDCGLHTLSTHSYLMLKWGHFSFRVTLHSMMGAYHTH